MAELIGSVYCVEGLRTAVDAGYASISAEQLPSHKTSREIDQTCENRSIGSAVIAKMFLALPILGPQIPSAIRVELGIADENHRNEHISRASYASDRPGRRSPRSPRSHPHQKKKRRPAPTNGRPPFARMLNAGRLKKTCSREGGLRGQNLTAANTSLN